MSYIEINKTDGKLELVNVAYICSIEESIDTEQFGLCNAICMLNCGYIYTYTRYDELKKMLEAHKEKAWEKDFEERVRKSDAESKALDNLVMLFMDDKVSGR